jgi:2-C-methyl-D-erythritol 4-phosphate cytidylyltransferase
MSDKGITPIVSEYNILWEALHHYKSRLEKLSSMTTDEDQEIMYDEKIQDLEGLLNSIKLSAKKDFDLMLK